ncbi:MAG: pyruvate:ferredoxin (flavodoxin) oxidoreductase [Acidobacteriia bacterium]|nr:pyruvate:ferredoxin (flavodoxin) oxidoreductase [Terriglobia bacterium]
MQTIEGIRAQVTIDGNEAAAWVAHQINEVIAIYPITPSSPMGEFSDQWSSDGRPNIWGSVPTVIEMQSEGGAAGALHGALQTGALATTFTSSQGLLLMIPNMYKIAGELTPAVLHVAARSLAAQALSIFGDHSDVMAVRGTGFAMLSSASVQEVMDFALIAQAASLESRIPFVHFFDGFRTSHEVNKVERLEADDLRAMLDEDHIAAHRKRALTPDRPVIRGTAQNPDVYFQARETVNPYYLACPAIVQNAMDRFATLTGRCYRLFDYHGAPDADRVIVIMGSGGETVIDTVDHLNAGGEKVGVVQVRLFRPFDVEHFLAAVPSTVRCVGVLDRTKEPGSIGEPLYQDVVTAVTEAWTEVWTGAKHPRVLGGRYGLSSKEFTPAMVKRVFEELSSERPRNHFTIGIHDDVTHTSLDFDPSYSTEDSQTMRCLFWGLGSDGTVGANKNSIKIIGEDTSNYAQGYFVYDSKKSGSVTVSHLRFGPNPIRAPYLISEANFIACHQFVFLHRFDILKAAQPGAIFLLNSAFGPEEVWAHLPRRVQEQIIEKKLRFYVIDGDRVAQEAGMGSRINTIMQTCFFAISGVLPREEAIEAIKKSIRKTYGKRGEAVVKKNFAAVDAAVDHLHEVTVPAEAALLGNTRKTEPASPPFALFPPSASGFYKDILSVIIAGNGDLLPVSSMPADGTYPLGTAQWEKRNISAISPIWDAGLCIQCGKCVLVCPHSVIRSKILKPGDLAGAPHGYLAVQARWKEFPDRLYTLQVAAEDCTGCALCVAACPAKSKSDVKHKAINMESREGLLETERAHWDFFLRIPETPREEMNHGLVKDVQVLEPLFEFSGACAGCGETPYIKLMTQLFGDHMVIANATGCSSIYGGNLPTTPYTSNAAGYGPAWSNSLFEDNAEFGLGMRVSMDKQSEFARELVERLAADIDPELAAAILGADQTTEPGIAAQRQRVRELRNKLEAMDTPEARRLLAVAGGLVNKSVWIVGGDGWAYDIGYGGLDHVLASGRNVNILVLDTEVYSNTGGQMSKATPRAAVAKFASGGKATAKKDLAMIAMQYGHVYVARIAMGANDTHTIKAFLEAEAHPGPSILIAYSHCIAHGYDMVHGLEQQKAAVQSGHWPLFRFNPALRLEGKNPFQLDSREPTISLRKYAYNEGRYTMLAHADPEGAERLMAEAERDAVERWKYYDFLASMPVEEPVADEVKS